MIEARLAACGLWLVACGLELQPELQLKSLTLMHINMQSLMELAAARVQSILMVNEFSSMEVKPRSPLYTATHQDLRLRLGAAGPPG